MMACGGVCVVSTADAVREVVGRQALLLAPSDLAGWRDAMRRVITDREYLAQYRGGGLAHAARFNLDRAAAMTLDVYRLVLGQSASSAISRRAA
jgi:glycosyltransferase involved in cell wall biosynthesis